MRLETREVGERGRTGKLQGLLRLVSAFRSHLEDMPQKRRSKQKKKKKKKKKKKISKKHQRTNQVGLEWTVDYRKKYDVSKNYRFICSQAPGIPFDEESQIRSKAASKKGGMRLISWVFND